MKKYLTPAVRLRIYDVVNALVGVAMLYGVLNGNEAAAWLLVVNATLGLARQNINTED